MSGPRSGVKIPSRLQTLGLWDAKQYRCLSMRSFRWCVNSVKLELDVCDSLVTFERVCVNIPNGNDKGGFSRCSSPARGVPVGISPFLRSRFFGVRRFSRARRRGRGLGLCLLRARRLGQGLALCLLRDGGGQFVAAGDSSSAVRRSQGYIYIYIYTHISHK